MVIPHGVARPKMEGHRPMAADRFDLTSQILRPELALNNLMLILFSALVVALGFHIFGL